MNDHLPQSIREALAPFAPYVPYAPPVESLNDDDAYVVDLASNCVVRQCSAALLRSGGSIPVGLNQAVMTGMHARHHIEREAERRALLAKQMPFGSNSQQIEQALAHDLQHLNCPHCGGSGHIDDTEQRLRGKDGKVHPTIQCMLDDMNGEIEG